MALRSRYRIPISINVFGDHIGNPLWLRHNPVLLAADALSRWALRRADSIRVDSQLVRRRLIQMGLPDDRIYTYPVFVPDIERFAGADGTSVRDRFGLANRPVVLFIGRLTGQKNVPNLLRALSIVRREIPDLMCLIVGSGPERSYLDALAQKMNLEEAVLFAGAVSYSDLQDYYAACDLFVLSSDYEGVPRVVVEAAAAGKPVVATRVGGVPEVVIEGQTGYLVPPRNSEQLANRIIDLIRGPELRLAMGRQALCRVAQGFSEKELLPKYLKYWLATSRARG